MYSERQRAILGDFRRQYIEPLSTAAAEELPPLLERAKGATLGLWETRGRFNKGIRVIYDSDGQRRLSLRAAILVSLRICSGLCTV